MASLNLGLLVAVQWVAVEDVAERPLPVKAHLYLLWIRELGSSVGKYYREELCEHILSEIYLQRIEDRGNGLGGVGVSKEAEHHGACAEDYCKADLFSHTLLSLN